jgi:hypothetical protein
MRGPGLGMTLAHLRKRRPTRKCERCGLRYTIDKDQCPHCGDLTEAQLVALQQRIAQHHQANRRLGLLFLLGAMVIMALTLLAFL